MKILYNAGFISIEDKGRERYCTLKQDGFNELRGWMDFYDKFWLGKLKKLDTLLNQKSKH